MKPKNISLFLLMAGVFILSCNDGKNIVPDSLSAYFPLQIGAYRIYNTTEIHYRPEQDRDSISYWEKHLVTSSFPGPDGINTYIIQRYRKGASDSIFNYVDTWSARVDSAQVILKKGSVAYVVLAFPLTEGKQWNGNAYNAQGGEDVCGRTNFPCDIYRVEKTAAPYTLNGQLWRETVEIIQQNSLDSIVKKDVRKEIYAKGVGLIYRKNTIFEYCTVGTCIGKQQINKGSSVEQIIHQYGNE